MSFLQEQKWYRCFEVPEGAENHFLQMMVSVTILNNCPTLPYLHKLTFATQQFLCLQSKAVLWQQLFPAAVGGIFICSY